MAETVKVPDIGDFDEVPVIEILVSEGDEVTEEQGLVTLESDKATMDVPSPVAGKVSSISVGVGDKVSEGSSLMEIEAGEATTRATRTTPTTKTTESGTEDDGADQSGDDEEPDASSDGEARTTDPLTKPKRPSQRTIQARRDLSRSARRSSAEPRAAMPRRAARTRRRGCSTPGRASGGWRASWGSTWRR